VKWTLRILGTLLLLIALAVAGAWFTFPWYAQGLIDRYVAGKNIRLTLHDPGRPLPGKFAFGRIDAIFTAQKDSCTGIAPIYVVAIHNGRLSWNTLPTAKGATARLVLEADSVTARMKPADIIFRDRNPRVTARLDIFSTGGLTFGVAPDSAAYTITRGEAQSGKLKLVDVAYQALLTKSANWVQQPSTFQAGYLFSAGAKTPLTDFKATFGMRRSPEKPCTLVFSDCSVNLSGVRAYTPRIEYSLRTKQTAFTLNLDSVPAERLAEIGGARSSNPSVTGTMSGSLPVEFRNTTLRIRNGLVDAGPGTLVTWKGAGGKPLFSFDAGRRKGGPPMLSGLDAEVTLNAKDDKLSGIQIGGLATTLFGGAVSASKTHYNTDNGSAISTIKLRNVPLLDRIRLHGEFSGSMKGTVSGTIPMEISRSGIAIRRARLSSGGDGTIRQRIAGKKEKTGQIFTETKPESVWSFSAPTIVFDRDPAGSTMLDFTLKNLKRQADGGELALTNAKGSISLPGEGKRREIVTLSGFSAGFFDGSIAIDRVDYDLSRRSGRTIVQLNGIPLQKLLDLQGTKKISATGTVRGRIPVVLDGDSFSIPDGGMDAEHSGQIVYSTTPEERSAANAGMRITYEALGNFLYSELVSTITMTPDGESRISLQLKGYNPDFQNGRAVNLNLNIDQNLLDLFRSLSISSGIEQEITEKALKKAKKR